MDARSTARTTYQRIHWKHWTGDFCLVIARFSECRRCRCALSALGSANMCVRFFFFFRFTISETWLWLRSITNNLQMTWLLLLVPLLCSRFGITTSPLDGEFYCLFWQHNLRKHPSRAHRSRITTRWLMTTMVFLPFLPFFFVFISAVWAKAIREIKKKKKCEKAKNNKQKDTITSEVHTIRFKYSYSYAMKYEWTSFCLVDVDSMGIGHSENIQLIWLNLSLAAIRHHNKIDTKLSERWPQNHNGYLVKWLTLIRHRINHQLVVFASAFLSKSLH